MTNFTEEKIKLKDKVTRILYSNPIPEGKADEIANLIYFEIKRARQEAISEARKEILDYLLKNGHGGGNFRRLIETLKEQQLKNRV